MHAFAIGLLLVAIQVSCDGAPQRLTPEPTPHTDVSEEKPADVSQGQPLDVPQEKHLVERAGKKLPQQTEQKSC